MVSIQSQRYNIPWSILKDYTKYLEDPARTSMAKTGKPFVIPPDIEIKILSMQDLGFGLTVNQVRCVAFKVVEAAGINHPFNREIQVAGWYWRDKLREQYNLSLRTPQNG
jgi:hypothetical protein